MIGNQLSTAVWTFENERILFPLHFDPQNEQYKDKEYENKRVEVPSRVERESKNVPMGC